MALTKSDILRARDGRAALASFLITPGGADLVKPVCWISVDGAGTLALTYADGTTDTVTLAAGVLHPICPQKVTGGTATGIHGWYGVYDPGP